MTDYEPVSPAPIVTANPSPPPRLWGRNRAGLCHARARAPAIGQHNNDEELLRAWGATDSYSQRIDLVERPDIVLMTQRNIDRDASCANLDIRWNDGLAAANGVPHRLAHAWVEEGGRMLDVTVHADDRRLAAVVVVEHNMDLVMKVADRVLVMDYG